MRIGLPGIRLAQNSVGLNGYTAAWRDLHTVAPSTIWASLVDRFVVRGQDDGWFPPLDKIGIFSGETSQGSLQDVRKPTVPWTLSNSPTFTAGRGFAPNGTTGSVRSGEQPNAAGNLFSLNSAYVGVWCNQANGGAGIRSQIGLSAGGRLNLTARSDAGNETGQICSTNVDTIRANPGTRLGWRALRRDAAGTTAGFLNGTKDYSGTSASTVIASGGNVCIGADVVNSLYSSDRFSLAVIGSSLSDAQAAALYAAALELLTAIGAN